MDPNASTRDEVHMETYIRDSFHTTPVQRFMLAALPPAVRAAAETCHRIECELQAVIKQLRETELSLGRCVRDVQLCPLCHRSVPVSVHRVMGCHGVCLLLCWWADAFDNEMM
jgi:hypothetical protein